MDINKLYYFFAAAESDSFTRAAEHCHIAQTTMSKYIAQLEEETGCTLFLRSKSGLTLTEEGKRFYEGMKEIDRKYRALLSSLAPQKALCHLGLASQEFKGLDFLPAFQKAFPEISLSCHMAPVPELENGLEAGTLDGIIAPDAIIFPKRFATIPLKPVPQCLVCSEAHAQSLKDIPHILSALPFLTKADNPSYVNSCRRKFQTVYHASFGMSETVPTFTEQLLRLSLGHGFSILPCTPGSIGNGLYLFRLPPTFEEWTCLVYRPSHGSPALQRLISFFHEKKC